MNLITKRDYQQIYLLKPYTQIPRIPNFSPIVGVRLLYQKLYKFTKLNPIKTSFPHYKTIDKKISHHTPTVNYNPNQYVIQKTIYGETKNNCCVYWEN